MDIPKNMEECVLNHAHLATTIGVVSGPLPHADIPAMIAIWADMLVKLACMSERKLDTETAKRIGLTVLVAVGTAQAAIKTVTTIGQWLLAIPSGGLSLLFGSAVNGGIDYATTRVVGMEAAELLIKDKLTAQNLLEGVLAALHIHWKGWGRKGPPDPMDYGL